MTALKIINYLEIPVKYAGAIQINDLENSSLYGPVKSIKEYPEGKASESFSIEKYNLTGFEVDSYTYGRLELDGKKVDELSYKSITERDADGLKKKNIFILNDEQPTITNYSTTEAMENLVDNRLRLKVLTHPKYGQMAFYDDNGRLIRERKPSGIIYTLKFLKDKSSLIDIYYEYDASGNIDNTIYEMDNKKILECSYSYKYDAHKNWIIQKKYCYGDKELAARESGTKIREIYYYTR